MRQDDDDDDDDDVVVVVGRGGGGDDDDDDDGEGDGDMLTYRAHTSLISHRKYITITKVILTYCRVIHKSLRDFRTRLRNNQDRHGRKEHIK